MALALYPYYYHKIEKWGNILVVTKGREVRKQFAVLDKKKLNSMILYPLVKATFYKLILM